MNHHATLAGLSLLLPFATPGLVSAQQDRLFPVRQFEPWLSTSDVATSDVDRDGSTDVLALHAYANSASIYYGRPGGGFDRESVSTTEKMRSLDVGDLNGDLILDLACGRMETAGFAVVLGSGNRDFGAPAFTWAPGFAEDLRIADLDGDGAADIVAVVSPSPGIFLLKGDGAGGLVHQATLPLGTVAGAVGVGDLDNDGRIDLVTASLDGDLVSVFLGQGGFTFSWAGGYSVGSGHEDLALVDLDGDGYLDLLTADGGSGTVSVLLGDGVGGFTPGGQHPVGGQPRTLAVDDLDLDGEPDLVVGTGNYYNGQGLAILPGLGSGNFGAARSLYWGNSSVWVAIEDFDRDGAPDILSGNDSADHFSVLFARGPGGFHASTHLPVGLSAEDLTNGDFDGDGRADLCGAMGAWPGQGRLEVFLGDGAGGFNGAAGGPCGSNPIQVAAVDVNLDGFQDVLSTAHNQAAIRIHLSDGLGGLSQAGQYVIGGVSRTIEPTELNGDGARDLVCLTESDSIEVLLGDGLGGFTTIHAEQLTNPTKDLALGDLNGDGLLDIAVAASSNGYVLLGQSSGIFGAPMITPALGNWSKLTLADLNGDGLLDAGAVGSNSVSLKIGRGNGTFETSWNFVLLAGSILDVEAADLDEDGRIDLLVMQRAGGDDGALSIFFGEDSDTLPDPVHYEAGGGPMGWALDDFNGDDRLDVSCINRFGEDISVLLTQGSHGGPGTYCTAKVTAIGCVAVIGSSGTPSVSGGTSFRVTASQVMSRQLGLLFYGFRPLDVPFGGGTLCVGGPQTRTSVAFSGGAGPPSDCSGSFDFDFGTLIASGADPRLTSGTTVFTQYWFRDPTSASGSATSNALRIVIAP